MAWLGADRGAGIHDRRLRKPAQGAGAIDACGGANLAPKKQCADKALGAPMHQNAVSLYLAITTFFKFAPFNPTYQAVRLTKKSAM